MSEPGHELSPLASHLQRRREAILRAWRAAIKKDRTLTTAHALPQAQLDDHVPRLLARYEEALDPARGQQCLEPAATQDDPAAAHGLHRWQQGYDLQEVTGELARLNQCVVLELEHYAREHLGLDPDVMTNARAVWAEMIGLEASKSIAEYFRLRQVEASGHIRDLEQALEKVQELEQQRADLWHQAAHDLRGNLNVVVSATHGLTKGGASRDIQENFLRVLDRNVTSLRHLLDDVMDLARLQAGRERREVSDVDVGALLAPLCDDLETLAEKRGLYLKYGGPSHFEVQGDPVKIRRFVQNLVINAIKYTTAGGVTVCWGDSAEDDSKRWMFSVQDTGPALTWVLALPSLARWRKQPMPRAKRNRNRERLSTSRRVERPAREVPAAVVRVAPPGQNKGRGSASRSSNGWPNCWPPAWRSSLRLPGLPFGCSCQGATRTSVCVRPICFSRHPGKALPRILVGVHRPRPTSASMHDAFPDIR